MSELTVVPVLAVANGRPVVTSLNIADVFGKLHKNVLQSIESLEVPEEFGRLNFQPSSYLNAQSKQQPMYNITRDGFVLLAMGFTGKEAVKFKLAYIDAFNKMEGELTGTSHHVAPAVIRDTFTPLAKTFRGAIQLAKLAGLKSNQAILAADKAVSADTGISPLAKIGAQHLICDAQERNLTPTEIASFKEVSDVARVVFCIEKDKKATAQHINILIERMGFQTSRYVDKQKVWSMTETGKPFATLVDASKPHGGRTPIQQLKWKESVVKEIVKYFASNGRGGVPMILEDDRITLSNGRVIGINSGYIAIDARRSGEYIGVMRTDCGEETVLTMEDRKSLAELMIARWQEFGGIKEA